MKGGNMATRLYDLLEITGVSRRKVSRFTNIDTSVISRLASGKTKLTSLYIDKLAHFFNCTTDFLLNYNDTGIIIVRDRGGDYFTTLIDIDTYKDLKKNDALNETIVEDTNSFILRQLNTTEYAEKFYKERVSKKTKKCDLNVELIDNYFDSEYQRQVIAIMKEHNMSDLFGGGDKRFEKAIWELAKKTYKERFNKDFNVNDCPFYINLALGISPKGNDEK